MAVSVKTYTVFANNGETISVSATEVETGEDGSVKFINGKDTVAWFRAISSFHLAS